MSTSVISAPGQNADKSQLSQPPKKSNDEYAAFVRRAIRGHARRVAAGDVEALADMVALSAELEQALQTAVDGLRAFGYSWTEIADRLGVSRQAARQRWMTT
jgi:DNA-directed RNA polymerase specialized sigma24 family protein